MFCPTIARLIHLFNVKHNRYRMISRRYSVTDDYPPAMDIADTERKRKIQASSARVPMTMEVVWECTCGQAWQNRENETAKEYTERQLDVDEYIEQQNKKKETQ